MHDKLICCAALLNSMLQPPKQYLYHRPCHLQSIRICSNLDQHLLFWFCAEFSHYVAVHGRSITFPQQRSI